MWNITKALIILTFGIMMLGIVFIVMGDTPGSCGKSKSAPAAAVVPETGKDNPATEPAPETKVLDLQTTCPVMTGNKIDKKLYVDYKGQRIYVCCGGCIDQVKADPEKYIEILKNAGQQPEKLPVKSAEKAL